MCGNKSVYMCVSHAYATPQKRKLCFNSGAPGLLSAGDGSNENFYDEELAIGRTRILKHSNTQPLKLDQGHSRMTVTPPAQRYESVRPSLGFDELLEHPSARLRWPWPATTPTATTASPARNRIVVSILVTLIIHVDGILRNTIDNAIKQDLNSSCYRSPRQLHLTSWAVFSSLP